MRTIDCASSSNIAAIFYDAPQHELRVSFKDGSTYIYQDVPKELVDQLDEAPSKGSFIHARIKPNRAVQRLN